MELRASDAQPFVFIETDPESSTHADGCQLGAALAEGARGWKHRGRILGRFSSSGAASRARTPPRRTALDFQRSIWSPREPDWWIVARSEVRSGEDVVSDTMDEEDRKRHAALREGRLVHLSDALCDAASQWTPELVDVAAAVLDAMVFEASTRATAPTANEIVVAETARGARADANAATVEAAVEKNGSSKARPSRAPEGSYVGATPADRDAATLRAQLEPLTTFRASPTIGKFSTEARRTPRRAQRPEVMRRLLECYDAEGGAEGRAVVDVAGAPVDSKICERFSSSSADGSRGGDARRGRSVRGPTLGVRGGVHDHSLPGGFRDDARRGESQVRAAGEGVRETHTHDSGNSPNRRFDPWTLRLPTRSPRSR